MAYKNPKPILHDEKTDISVQQRGQTATEYTLKESVYFAFVDVLGFKQTFDENRKNPNGGFATAYKESFQYFSLLMNNAQFAKTKNSWNAGQTSDSLYFYTDRVDYLAVFIKLYSHFSLYAMSKDVFLRGGIAKGNLYVDMPHQFYGDSVIKAYLLESNIAKLPYVVIDQSTYADLKNEGSAEDFLVGAQPPKRNYIKPFAHISDAELQTFISVSAIELHRIAGDEWAEIKKNIDKNLERFEFDEKNYQKYAFLLQQQLEFEISQNNK